MFLTSMPQCGGGYHALTLPHRSKRTVIKDRSLQPFSDCHEWWRATSACLHERNSVAELGCRIGLRVGVL